jgi:hypothetical protein
MYSRKQLAHIGCLTVAAVASAMIVGSMPVPADCGSIPYRTPYDRDPGVVEAVATRSRSPVRFDPTGIVVYEPGQRAIILWNGYEEILLLSTDIRTSQDVSILEVIPFPAEPQVRLSDFDSFKKMNALLADRKAWYVSVLGGMRPIPAPATITFHEKMGAHDIAVVNVLDKDRFVGWVMGFLAGKSAVNPQIRPEFVQIIGNYLDRGFTWFVFDTIETADRLQSRQPIEYRFRSDSVFYPIEISSLETGRTTIDLTVVTKSRLTSFSSIRFASRKTVGSRVTPRDLDRVSPGWTQFMNASRLSVDRVQVKGDIRYLTTDFVAR